MSVTEILEALPALSPEDRAQVKALLDTLPDQSADAEDQARQTLMRAGLLRRPQARRTRFIASGGTPVEIKGAPLSETIIEERR